MVTREDAGKTLQDIDSTMERTMRGLGYRAASPHLLIWGVVWLLGYGLSALRPEMQLHWPALALAGAIASGVAGARTGGVSGGGWKFAVSACIAAGFFFALFAILPPLDSRQVGVIFPLVVSALYGGVGVWACRAKLGLTGLAVGLIALTAYFTMNDWFDAIMAIVGGGALILGGLWMRNWS